ncbi:MAG TPA: pyridoxal phosphate-dependent aminotransferase [Thermoanaerobaculia bacterium]|nr:pyridoxal phosphate-dependent aminotransferase [Thermoanaerobaculia bacterium]
MTQQLNNPTTQQPAARLANIELSLIRQINALATPLSTNLGIGEPNLEPDDTLREFARRAVTTTWHYSANAGHLSLRRKLGDPDEVCVTAGTQEALYAIFQAYVDPGDEVLVPDPGFVAYATLAKICGAEAVPYPIEPPSWQLDARAITQRITAKTKLIIVNSPSNPLGSVASRAALEEVANAGPLVVSDEVYRQLWYDAEPPSMRGLSDRVIVVDGMSKSHGMTGLRIAWTIAKPDVLKPIITAHQYIATCASVFSQALAELVFDAPEWNASWLARARAQLRDQREVALHAIERELDVQLAPPPAAFYAFVPVPSCDTLTFAKTLATDAAVLVIPGAAFGINGEGFVRISYAASHDAIGTGIERIGRWLRANGR